MRARSGSSRRSACGRRRAGRAARRSRPSSSCGPCSIGGNSASPLNSAVTPAGSTLSRTESSNGDDGLAVLAKITRSNCASAYAMRPSSETVFSSNGSPTLSMPALSSVGLNSEVLSFAIACSIAALRSGVSSCSPSGRGEDEVEHAALLGGELRLDQVGRLLRVGAGDVELVLQAPADRRDEHDQQRHDPDPAEDHAPGMRRAHARPAGEPAGRETFVRSLALAPGFQVLLRHAFAPSRSTGLHSKDRVGARDSSVAATTLPA